MNTLILGIVCCCFLQFVLSSPGCKVNENSETFSDDCKTLVICQDGTEKMVECKEEGEVVGTDYTCVSENSDKNACGVKEINRRWLNKKQDCLWEWTEWSAPYGFGNRERTVIIYRHPHNGGTPCPTAQTETKPSTTSQPPPVEVVAKQIVDSFLNPRPSFRRTRDLDENNRHIRAATSNKRDLLVILDSSGSIGSSNFDNVKTNLAKLLGLMCPKNPEPFRSDIHRAALINYSSRVIKSFNFNTYTGTTQIQDAIRSQTYMGMGTGTAAAFDQALDMFDAQKGMRSNTQHEVLVLTDGRSNEGDYKPALKKLKDSGVKVFALAIGIDSAGGRTEIEDYVSEPKDKHLFALSDFERFDDLIKMIEKEISSITCAPFDTP